MQIFTVKSNICAQITKLHDVDTLSNIIHQTKDKTSYERPNCHLVTPCGSWWIRL